MGKVIPFPQRVECTICCAGWTFDRKTDPKVLAETIRRHREGHDRIRIAKALQDQPEWIRALLRRGD